MMDCKKCFHYWNNGKDEYCETRGWDFKRIDCPDFQDKSKPATNADRIRSMTDDDLAELLTAVAQKSAGKLCESLKSVEVDLSNCNFQILYEAHLDWLREEAVL